MTTRKSKSSTPKPHHTDAVVVSERPLRSDAPSKEKKPKTKKRKAKKAPPDANLPVTKGDLRKAVEDIMKARREPTGYRVTLTGCGTRRRVDVSHIPRVGELIVFRDRSGELHEYRVNEVQHGDWQHDTPMVVRGVTLRVIDGNRAWP